jgi:hypothetical protein
MAATSIIHLTPMLKWRAVSSWPDSRMRSDWVWIWRNFLFDSGEAWWGYVYIQEGPWHLQPSIREVKACLSSIDSAWHRHDVMASWLNTFKEWDEIPLSMVYKQDARELHQSCETQRIVLSEKHSFSCSAQDSQPLVVLLIGHSRLQFAQWSINSQSSGLTWPKLLILRQSIVSSSDHFQAQQKTCELRDCHSPNPMPTTRHLSALWRMRNGGNVLRIWFTSWGIRPVKWRAKCQCGQVTYL